MEVFFILSPFHQGAEWLGRLALKSGSTTYWLWTLGKLLNTGLSILTCKTGTQHSTDLLSFYVRGVKLIFTGGHISLAVAFKGPNVILGLYKCNYSLTRGKELSAAAR